MPNPKTNSIFVLAKPGLVVPRLGRKRERIPCGDPAKDAHKACRVEPNRTYRRMISDGELAEIPTAKVLKAKAAARKKRVEARKAGGEA